MPFNQLDDKQFVTKLRLDALPFLEPLAPPTYFTPLMYVLMYRRGGNFAEIVEVEKSACKRAKRERERERERDGDTREKRNV